ncbi:hypothetical protein JW711_05485 [Candidatus Woesearchaeota archaeon]|nr:hypothetical protein [Candidatus Woesearchaeota archaeon]
MHSTEQKILAKFKKEPHREISTTELVEETHPQEYAKILEELEKNDKQTIINAKREKGKLHRKVLYHLNSLVSENILKIASTRGKGEKLYSLTIDEGELVVTKRHKQIIIHKPSISTQLIEEYENKGIIYKYDAENWLGKLNCIILDCHQEDGINKLYDLARSCFSEVNDCIGLDHFESIIDKNSPENTEEILEKMDLDSRDYEKKISLVICLKTLKDEEKHESFARAFAAKKPRNISIIFKGNSRSIKDKERLFSRITEYFQRQEIKLNFQNNHNHKAPIVIGKAGTYTLSNEDWKDYKENIRGKSKGIGIANSTIGIDLHRFFSLSHSSQEFRDMIIRSAKTLMRVSIAQNMKAKENFKRLITSNEPYAKKFFSHQKSYIRFWNYDFSDKRQEHLPALLESSKEELAQFCAVQNRIYNACGLPLRYEAVFSSLFHKISDKLSSRNYKKTMIKSFKEYESPEVKEFIRRKELLSKLFDGGDRCRIFRKGDFKPEDAAHELSYLMNKYNLPLITFEFKEMRGEMKLTQFM